MWHVHVHVHARGGGLYDLRWARRHEGRRWRRGRAADAPSRTARLGVHYSARAHAHARVLTVLCARRVARAASERRVQQALARVRVTDKHHHGYLATGSGGALAPPAAQGVRALGELVELPAQDARLVAQLRAQLGDALLPRAARRRRAAALLVERSDGVDEVAAALAERGEADAEDRLLAPRTRFEDPQHHREPIIHRHPQRGLEVPPLRRFEGGRVDEEDEAVDEPAPGRCAEATSSLLATAAEQQVVVVVQVQISCNLAVVGRQAWRLGTRVAAVAEVVLILAIRQGLVEHLRAQFARGRHALDGHGLVLRRLCLRLCSQLLEPRRQALDLPLAKVRRALGLVVRRYDARVIHAVPRWDRLSQRDRLLRFMVPDHVDSGAPLKRRVLLDALRRLNTHSAGRRVATARTCHRQATRTRHRPVPTQYSGPQGQQAPHGAACKRATARPLQGI